MTTSAYDQLMIDSGVGGSPSPSTPQSTRGSYDQLMIDSGIPTPAQQSPIPAQQSLGLMNVLKNAGKLVSDSANALGTGAIRGLLRTYNPVDALANVRDLGKVVMGTPMLMSGKVPPDWLQVQNRMDTPGSSERIIAGSVNNPITNALLNPSNPSYEGGYLQNAGGALGGIMSPSSLTNAAVQAARNATVATVGKGVADVTESPTAGIVATLAPALVTRRSIPAEATPRSTAASEALANGYVLRPSDAGNTSWLNSALEGFAGKTALNQDISYRNMLNRSVQTGLEQGVPVGSPVTSAALEAQRERLGTQGYAPISALGDIPVNPIAPNYSGLVDPSVKFQQALIDINRNRGRSQTIDPTLQNDVIAKATGAYSNPTYTGKQINEEIKNQREVGNRLMNTMYGSDVNAVPIGEARIGISKALEDLVNEHLMNQGPSNVVPNLLEARKKIAQNYTVDRALTNPTSGEVNAAPFVRRYESIPQQPLEGAQLIAGEFGSYFPQANRPRVTSDSPQMSTGDMVTAIGSGLMGYTLSGAKGMATGFIPALRSPVRNMLLSKRYQENFANPSNVNGPWGSIDPQYLGALTRSLQGTGILDKARESQ